MYTVVWDDTNVILVFREITVSWGAGIIYTNSLIKNIDKILSRDKRERLNGNKYRRNAVMLTILFGMALFFCFVFEVFLSKHI